MHTRIYNTTLEGVRLQWILQCVTQILPLGQRYTFLQTVILVNFLGFSDLGHSKTYPPKKRTNYCIFPLPTLRKKHKACEVPLHSGGTVCSTRKYCSNPFMGRNGRLTGLSGPEQEKTVVDCGPVALPTSRMTWQFLLFQSCLWWRRGVCVQSK